MKIQKLKFFKVTQSSRKEGTQIMRLLAALVEDSSLVHTRDDSSQLSVYLQFRGIQGLPASRGTAHSWYPCMQGGNTLIHVKYK